MRTPDPHFDDPVALHDYLLEVTKPALLGGDERTFIERFDLPQTIGTFDGAQVLRTEDDVRRVLHGVRGYIMSHAVTDLERRCISAEFIEPGRMIATHVSRYIAGAQLVGKDVISHSSLRCVDGFWMISDNQYAVTKAPQLSAALSGVNLHMPTHFPQHTTPQNEDGSTNKESLQ